jgi:hypothetical protein
MAKYAASTGVRTEASRSEIERILRRYGATAFARGWQDGGESVMFEIGGRRIRFLLPMPDRDSREFTHTPERGLERSRAQAEQAYEQATRQRWRALVLIIKAKLEAVEAGITTVEEEFLAHVVIPDGRTVSEWLEPQLAAVYGRGEMPALLPGGSR